MTCRLTREIFQSYSRSGHAGSVVVTMCARNDFDRVFRFLASFRTPAIDGGLAPAGPHVTTARSQEFT